MTTSTVRMLSPLATAVAGNIRAEAGRAGYRQVHLARELGMSQPAASERWRGVTPWTLNEIHEVSRILDVPLEVLLRCAIRDSNPEPAD